MAINTVTISTKGPLCMRRLRTEGFYDKDLIVKSENGYNFIDLEYFTDNTVKITCMEDLEGTIAYDACIDIDELIVALNRLKYLHGNKNKNKDKKEEENI